MWQYRDRIKFPFLDRRHPDDKRRQWTDSCWSLCLKGNSFFEETLEGDGGDLMAFVEAWLLAQLARGHGGQQA